PFTLNGKFDTTGFKCIPKDPADQQASFTNNCNGAATFAFACIVKRPTGITGNPTVGIGQLGGLVDLRARMLQLIHPGQISTLPAQPNPALVNTPTCFFIDGSDIDGQSVNLSAEFELVILGLPDATARQVYYVFR